jgi:hypothetical protein
MKCVVLIGMFAVAGVASAGVVSFEELGTQTYVFSETTALRNQIAGVSFGGPGAKDGGGILNQIGGFGFEARSGEHFLAFNRGAVSAYQGGGSPIDPQRITFDTPVSSVEIYAATAWDYEGNEVFGAYQILAYTKDDSLVAVSSFKNVGLAWTRLSLTDSQAFDYIVLTETTGANAFACDDLSYKSVPSAGGAGLLAIAGVFGARRRRA